MKGINIIPNDQQVTITGLTMNEALAIKHIVCELNLAKLKHHSFVRGLELQALVLIEEAGEVAKAIVDYNAKQTPKNFAHIAEEIAQTGAMAIRMWSEMKETSNPPLPRDTTDGSWQQLGI